MSNPKEITRSPGYQKVVDSTPELEFQDFNPILVEDIFTKDQISSIYKIVQAAPLEHLKVAPWGGQASWFSTHFEQEVEDRIAEIGKAVFGDSVKLMGDYSFVRYSEEYGYEPKLFPHADKRKKPRMLLDIQLRADQDWGVIVEDTTYYLKDNQALAFSGTNQQHWREDIKISPHARIDMLFCNFEFVDGRDFPEHYDFSTIERSKYIRDFYNIQDTPRIADRKINELQ